MMFEVSPTTQNIPPQPSVEFMIDDVQVLVDQLQMAARVGDADLCRSLIDMGAPVKNFGSNWQWGPLLDAAWHGHAEVCELLIQAGADPNIRDSNGMTAIHRACEKNGRGFPHLIPELVRLGVNIDARNKFGETALHHACARVDGHDLVVTLLNAGANPNVSNGVEQLCQMPLHLAARFGMEMHCKTLLAHRADPLVRDAHGNTASDLAYQNGSHQIGTEIECAVRSLLAKAAVDRVLHDHHRRDEMPQTGKVRPKKSRFAKSQGRR